MTQYYNQSNLTLGQWDELVVQPGNVVYNTTIGGGAVEYVESLGTNLTSFINSGGVFYVFSGGNDYNSLNFGGIENVYGTATASSINMGATENIYNGAKATDTFIAAGTVNVYNGGNVNNVTIEGIYSKLRLAIPTGLTGTITDWKVGGLIDLLNTPVTSVTENASQTQLTVSYSGTSVVYELHNQQAHTTVVGLSDGNGGTYLELISTHR